MIINFIHRRLLLTLLVVFSFINVNSASQNDTTAIKLYISKADSAFSVKGENDKSSYNNAFSLLKKAEQIANEIDILQWYIKVNNKFSDLWVRSGNFSLALEYAFKNLKLLDDSDGVKMHKSFLYNQEYLDADGLDKACYTIKTFYNTKGVSLISDAVCVDYTELIQTPGKEISIFPNPVMNKFSIKNLNEDAKIQLVDLSGHVIYERIVAPLEMINVEQIPNGIYALRIITNTYHFDHKLIKF